jgi:molecular chaperone GrpE (heat shock protein)
MARGWESKSVEAQIEDAGARSASAQGQPLTAEQRERQRKLQGLELARRRTRHEMETTRSAARRAALEQALAFLDGEISRL